MYHHIFKKGEENAPVYVLLHGTGGNEQSLIPLAHALDTKASYLSVRGDVSEFGALRYFKRKAEGVYDVEDLMERGDKLYEFIVEASKKYGFSLHQVILIGFSNGANIAINLLLKGLDIQKGMLFAPMYPVEVSEEVDLSSVKVYLSMGKEDPIASVQDSEYVLSLFKNRQAQVHEFWVRSHEISPETVQEAKYWLEQLEK